jgi:hypothetical protein
MADGRKRVKVAAKFMHTNETKNIKVSNKMHERLSKHGRFEESFSELTDRVLDEAEAGKKGA